MSTRRGILDLAETKATEEIGLDRANESSSCAEKYRALHSSSDPEKIFPDHNA
jgi:hypothetical protein